MRGHQGADRRDHPRRHCRRRHRLRGKPGAGDDGPSGRRRLCRSKLHFIGHLQTNKVKQVVGKADLIESVDSERLLRAIDEQAGKLGIVQDVLLEVNVAGEESKSGISPEELPALAQLADKLEHMCLCGLMAIPPISHEPGANIPYFSAMRQLFVDIKRKMSDNQNRFMCLSMGMSGDYEDAVAQGATLVRVGTALFGPRPPMHPEKQ